MTLTMELGSTGCEPRFSTPRNHRRPTLGPAVGEVSRRLTKPLMPWQQQVVDVALELDEDGSYHYDEVVLTVPRQSGKTSLIMAMAVHRLVVVPRTLGRQRLTYTTSQRQKARQKLELDFAPTLREAGGSFKEITHIRARPQKATEWKMSLNNGMERIQFGRGNYLQIDAPSRTGGHGDTLDVGVIDEAFAHEDDAIETGMEPSMATRSNHQLIVLSTAGDARSTYLWRKTLAGRKACGTGDHGRTAYFEWSAPDDADPGDPTTWWSCSPALGITITERFLEGQWKKAQRDGAEGIARFCRSYLNQWPEVPLLEELTAGSDMDVDSWLSLAAPEAKRGSNVVFGVDVSTDRLAHIAVAWYRPDGQIQVQLADTAVSPLRTPTRLADLETRWKGPVMLGGTSASLEGDLRNAKVLSGSDFAAACGRLNDLINDKAIRHGNQPELNAAVRDAQLRSFGAAGERSLQLRDAPTVAPLAAAVRAVHGLLSGAATPPAKPQLVSAGARSGASDLTTVGF